MGIYVRNGTPLDGPSLCESCANGHIAKGYRIAEEIVMCTANSPTVRVPFRIRECTSYFDKRRECLYEMKKVAWLIEPERGKKTTGFAAPPESSDSDEDLELIFNEES